MAGNTTQVIIVAQAAEGAAIVEDHAAETHATTEADGHAAPTVFPPFDASTFPSQLLWLALTFGFLYVFMSRVALPRVGNILDTRKSRIDTDLAEADRLQREATAAGEAYAEALAQARANANAIAEETRQGIKADIDARRAKVEADLGARLTQAEASIGATKTAALQHVDEIAAETAAALVAQLTGEVSEQQARDAVAAVTKG